MNLKSYYLIYNVFCKCNYVSFTCIDCRVCCLRLWMVLNNIEMAAIFYACVILIF